MTETDKDLFDYLAAQLNGFEEIGCEAPPPDEPQCAFVAEWRFESGCCHKVWLICNFHAEMIYNWHRISNPMASVTCRHCESSVLVKDYFHLLERLA